MTEAEWHKSDSITTMLQFARAGTTDRKLRLFAVACCKNVWSFLPKYSRAAVGVAELYADGFATIAQLKEAEQQVSQDAIEAGYSDGAIVCGSYVVVKSAWIAAEGTSRSTKGVGWEPTSVPKPFRRKTAEHARVTQREYEVWRQKRFCEQAHLLRDICNPFRRNEIGVFPSTVIEFTISIYDERRYESMPILADVLEEAGCLDETILAHCRNSDLHTRGCWVIDHIIGKR